MVNSSVWRGITRALVLLFILQVVVASALHRDDVRRHLRSWMGATPTLWGRTLVVQVQPVSFVLGRNGAAVLTTDVPQHTHTFPYQVPTALRMTVWVPDQVWRTLGLLVDVVVPVDLLTTIPLGLLSIALVLVLWLRRSVVKRRSADRSDVIGTAQC
jgi:hypothetical protein